MGNRICPSCGNLMFLDNDGWWYCDYCGYSDEDLDLEELQNPHITDT
jgi:uncharacterized Zn finger protein (UPF0148 family)